jgi:DNA-binding NtrC family response regulator
MDARSAASPSLGTVLFCEDEFLILMDVTQGLRRAGFGVIEACNIAEARTALHSWSRIDVAVLDIRLPTPEEGLALLKWVLGFRPDVSVIVATGYDLDDEILATTTVIKKPYRPEDLVKHIGKLLATKRAPVAKCA